MLGRYAQIPTYCPGRCHGAAVGTQLSVGHDGWVYWTCQTTWPGHCQVGKAEQVETDGKSRAWWRKVTH